jgi:hypothetical protein
VSAGAEMMLEVESAEAGYRGTFEVALQGVTLTQRRLDYRIPREFMRGSHLLLITSALVRSFW